MPDAPPITNSRLETLSDQPLLVDDSHVERFVYGVNALPTEIEARINTDDDDFWGGWAGAYFRPYRVKDGILTVPITGSLLDKVSITWGGWITGYEYIRRAVLRGQDDPKVRGIILDIDSPGGEAAGNFELFDEIKGIPNRKPMVAVANGLALSGGYSMAAVADKIIVRPTGAVGSVGVITVHLEMSKALEKRGITATIIRSGKHKAEGNAYEPLSDFAKGEIQDRSDSRYGMFVERVAKGRGMSEIQVRRTEARVFGADDGIEIGFADSVGDIKSGREVLLQPGKGAQMSDEDNKQPEAGAEAKAEDKTNAEAKAQPESKAEEGAGLTEAQVADIAAKAVAADRKRTADVIQSDEYAGREALAAHLLTNSEDSAESIIATLKVSPKAEGEQPTGRRDHFAEHMARQPATGVEQEDPDNPDNELQENGKTAGANALLSAAKAAGLPLRKQPSA